MDVEMEGNQDGCIFLSVCHAPDKAAQGRRCSPPCSSRSSSVSPPMGITRYISCVFLPCVVVKTVGRTIPILATLGLSHRPIHGADSQARFLTLSPSPAASGLQCLPATALIQRSRRSPSCWSSRSFTDQGRHCGRSSLLTSLFLPPET